MVCGATLNSAMAARYPDALYLELGPGNVLVGLVKKIAPSVRTASLGSVADFEKTTSILFR